jgi:hypothetical protein
MNTGETPVSLQVTDSSFELSYLRMNTYTYSDASYGSYGERISPL